jgi:hypothetical protein
MGMCGGHSSRLPDLPSWHAEFFTACEKGLFWARFNLGKFLRSRRKVRDNSARSIYNLLFF